VPNAEARGLLNLKTTPDALKYMLQQKNIDLFTSHRVFSEVELRARHEVRLENYCKVVGIEALTMLDMARKNILPAMSAYTTELAEAASVKSSVLDVDCSYETETARTLCGLLNGAYKAVRKLEADVEASKSMTDPEATADFFKDTIIADMAELRTMVDSMEVIASSEMWPYPSYGEILFGVR